MDTPLLSHLSNDDYSTVYEPAEDSFLMLDALENEIDFIEKLKPATCLEIGPGSGINITAFAKVFKSCFCFAVDINPKACDITLLTSERNNTLVECINGDLMKTIKGQSIDVILFNPPYVVTDSEEIKKNGISQSWAGGVRGREVIDQFLPLLPSTLSDKGICYMVVIEENDPEEIGLIMKEMQFSMSIVIERKVRNERLKVIKFERIK